MNHVCFHRIMGQDTGSNPHIHWAITMSNNLKLNKFVCWKKMTWSNSLQFVHFFVDDWFCNVQKISFLSFGCTVSSFLVVMSLSTHVEYYYVWYRQWYIHKCTHSSHMSKFMLHQHFRIFSSHFLLSVIVVALTLPTVKHSHIFHLFIFTVLSFEF